MLNITPQHTIVDICSGGSRKSTSVRIPTAGRVRAEPDQAFFYWTVFHQQPFAATLLTSYTAETSCRDLNSTVTSTLLRLRPSICLSLDTSSQMQTGRRACTFLATALVGFALAWQSVRRAAHDRPQHRKPSTQQRLPRQEGDIPTVGLHFAESLSSAGCSRQGSTERGMREKLEQGGRVTGKYE